MKYSTKLSDTVHVMVLIAINQEKSLSSASIAESVHTNPGFVRQLMLKLKKAELMTSVAGHARPSLSKPADQITLLDIYKAVEGDKPLLHLDTHTNPDCGVGINIQLSLQGFYNEIQKKTDKVRVVYFDGEFNYSKVNNFGVQYATGEYILFLNNDTEVITEKWLEKMVGYCQLQKTGIVGAKLLYPDDSVQHCGVVIGVGGFAGHILTLSDRNEVGYFGKLQAVQNVSAVTGACLMIKRSVFEQVEGFDEGFKVALNDIDLCLKVRKSGYDVIIHPGVELYHYESKSRGLEETPEKHERFKREISRFRDRWKKELDEGDPFYNPNLTLMYGDCRIRETHEHFDIIDEIEAEKYNQ